MKVFLSGTDSGSTWRKSLIARLNGVEGHTIECYASDDFECEKEERKQKAYCNFVLHVITPLTAGVFEVANAVDCSNKRPYRTLFCVIYEDAKGNKFDSATVSSFEEIKKLIAANNATVLEWNELPEFLLDTDRCYREYDERKRKEMCGNCFYDGCVGCTRRSVEACEYCPCCECGENFDNFEDRYMCEEED